MGSEFDLVLIRAMMQPISRLYDSDIKNEKENPLIHSISLQYISSSSKFGLPYLFNKINRPFLSNLSSIVYFPISISYESSSSLIVCCSSAPFLSPENSIGFTEFWSIDFEILSFSLENDGKSLFRYATSTVWFPF